jgi:SAM-dependent methyltransferase
MNDASHSILPHHQAAATMWGRGGRAYDDISFGISDVLAHAARRLHAGAGDTILDVATGTGWSARNAARSGAQVVAVDISQELLAAATALSAHIRPAIDFRLADAEHLPFEDARFDRIISTFGVMFAAHQEQAARELGRVCKRGGRLVLATWTPDGAVAEFFAVVGKHSGMPPPQPSPLAWGDPEHVERLLGRDFDLTFERAVNHDYHEDVDDIWGWFARGFGPVRQLVETLEPDALEALREDVATYHRHYTTEAGLLHIERDYLLTIGRRR